MTVLKILWLVGPAAIFVASPLVPAPVDRAFPNPHGVARTIGNHRVAERSSANGYHRRNTCRGDRGGWLRRGHIRDRLRHYAGGCDFSGDWGERRHNRVWIHRGAIDRHRLSRWANGMYTIGGTGSRSEL